MRQSNTSINQRLDEVLATARGIKFAMKNGALSYEEAKERVRPLLAKVNEVCKLIAKKYGRKYIEIRFADL
jgi:hypothetical protein